MFGSNHHWFPDIRQQFRPPFIHSPQQWEYPHDSYFPEAQFNVVSPSFNQQQSNISDYHNNTWRNGRGHANQRGNYNRNLKQNNARKGCGGFQGYNGIGAKGSKEGSYYCDSCDRGFGSDEQLQNHLKNEHIICGLEGCTLSAHPKVVENHQKIQHVSGLYRRLKSNSSQDSDDVAKWIAERKRNYPTKENIQRYKEEEEERKKRGECLEPEKGGFRNFRRSSRGRRGGGRTRGGRRNRDDSGLPRKQRVQQSGIGKGFGGQRMKGRGKGENSCNGLIKNSTVMAKEEMEVEDEEPRGIPMFVGTALFLGISLDKCVESSVEEDSSDFSDLEWIQDEEGRRRSEENKDNLNVTNDLSSVKNEIALNNSLGFLMGAYGSDSSNSDEEIPPKIQPAWNNKNCRSERKTEPTPPVNKNSTNVKSYVEETKINSVTNQSHVKEIEKLESDDSRPKELPIYEESEITNSKLNQEKKKNESDESGPEEIPIVKEFNVESKSEEMKKGEIEESGPRKEPILKGSHGRKEEEHHGNDNERGRWRRCRKRVRNRKREMIRKEFIAKKPKEDNGENMKEVSVTEKLEGQEINTKGPSTKERVRKERQWSRPMRKPTLLEQLLKDEIRHERNTILQCVRYVIENNFFDTMEVKSSISAAENKQPVIEGAAEPSSKEDIGANAENILVTSEYQDTIPSTESVCNSDIYFDPVETKESSDMKTSVSETINDSCAISEMVSPIERMSPVNASSMHSSLLLSQEEVVNNMEENANQNAFPPEQVEGCDKTSQEEVKDNIKMYESSCLPLSIRENVVLNEIHLTPAIDVDLDRENDDTKVDSNENVVNSGEFDNKEIKVHLEVADDVGKDGDSTIPSLAESNNVHNNENLITMKENDSSTPVSDIPESGTALLEDNE